MRLLPELTPANECFWTSGADGRLRVQGCAECAVVTSGGGAPSGVLLLQRYGARARPG